MHIQIIDMKYKYCTDQILKILNARSDNPSIPTFFLNTEAVLAAGAAYCSPRSLLSVECRLDEPSAFLIWIRERYGDSGE